MYDTPHIPDSHIESRNDLTELPNRRRLNEYIETLLDHNKRFSVLLIDLDDFKQVNDKFDYEEGDAYIKNAAEVIEASIRSSTSDLFHRSGDEFNVVLTDVDIERVDDIMRRIQQNLDDIGSPASIGVAHYEEGDDKSSIHARSHDNLIKDKKKRQDEIVYTAQQQTVIEIVRKMLDEAGLSAPRFKKNH